MTRKGTRVNRGLLISSTVLSTMNITIKTMSYSQRKDRDILQSCLKTWFRNPKDLHLTDPRMTYPFDFRQWCSLSYQDDHTATFVAQDQKWIVAYLSIRWNPERKRGHFFHLFVDPGHRRKGLAKQLLNYGIQFANSVKLNEIILHVAPKNIREKTLYKSHGFNESGINSRGNIIMSKDL